MRINIPMSSNPTTEKAQSLPGKLGLSLFFLFFLGMGLIFEVLIFHELAVEVNSYFWPKAECVVTASSVQEPSGDSKQYSFKIQYEYNYQGKTYQSDQFRKKQSGFSEYSDAKTLADSYPEGFRTICCVNPKAPDKAILKHNSLWLVFFALIPAVFILIGGGGIYGIWFHKSPLATEKTNNRPHVRNKSLGKAGLIIFGFVFFAVGVAVSYFMLVRPLINIFQARNWIETPCKVISANVQSHDSDDGTTFSVDILFEYCIDEKSYRSNRYDFMGGSSSGYTGKKEIVDRYLRMENPTCHVDPGDHQNAVLMKDLAWKYAVGLFPMIFVVVGLGIMIAGVSKLRKAAKSPLGQEWLPRRSRESDFTSQASSEYRDNLSPPLGDSFCLKPLTPPSYKFLGILFFCLFWNGLISFFVVTMVNGFRMGRPEWILTLFLIPFEIVGLCLLGAVVYNFMALFNPQFKFSVRPPDLSPGSSGKLEWETRGGTSRTRILTIKLVGREEATYAKGTNTQTDKKIFFEKEIFNSSDVNAIGTGQTAIEIPAETMHSFEAENNKIIWTIEMHGDIARWPDVKEEYKLIIKPKKI